MVIGMKKIFSNIIIFTDRDKDIAFVKEKVEKMILDLDNVKANENDYKFKIDIIQDSINNITILSSDYLKFNDLESNKSLIRKISKRIANDTFMISSIEDNTAILEKYSFNKRIYDYIVFGDKEKLESLGYNEEYGTYMYKDIWTNHFVGRNTIEDVEKLLDESNTFFDYYELFVEILKLYGIRYELATYNDYDSSFLSHEVVKETLYFK